MNENRNKQIKALQNTSYSKKERNSYNEHRERVTKALGIDHNAYNAYRRHAHKLTEADTNSANGTRNGEEPRYVGNRIANEYTEEHYDKDTNETHKKLDEMTKKHKLHYYHQTDPRGASLHLSKKELNQQNYNSEGHPIY